RNKWTAPADCRVCSDHFVSGTPSSNYTLQHQDWAPTLDIGIDRSKGRRVKFFKQGNLSFKTAKEEKSTGVNLELQRLLTENLALRRQISQLQISEDMLKVDSKMVNYYTGLPNYAVLSAVYKLIEPYIDKARSNITKFQQMLIVLMKMRLDLHFTDLANRFDVDPSTISRIFRSVVHVMSVRLKPLILWPERDSLRLTMPMEFRKHFGQKVVCIIDCFEIPTEKPSALLAQAQMWSNYKHSHTVKYLIGIAPQGVVSFISQGYGGRTSDKQITEECGILDNLLPDDIVLADRGFDVAESIGLRCAQLKTPAFTKGKKQLSAMDVEQTRKVAHVRIHVERVIGLVRNKYTILQNRVPINLLNSPDSEEPLLDKLVTISCALSNLSPSIVPFN
ncbi:unnamed protein product, partial [Meganyctiphanes norvegica]